MDDQIFVKPEGRSIMSWSVLDLKSCDNYYPIFLRVRAVATASWVHRVIAAISPLLHFYDFHNDPN